MKVGITSPRFHIGWNTDLRIQSYFINPGINKDINFSYCGGLRYSTRLALQKINTKLGLRNKSSDLEITNFESYKYFYCYGSIPSALMPSLSSSRASALFTTGVMSPHYMQAAGDNANPVAEVTKLDKLVPPNVPFHFHTRYGLDQFRSVATSGRSSYAVPFFLPHLASYKPSQPSTGVNIAFIGKDGKRKGLYVLLEALKRLPSDYLYRNAINLVVVSSSKPYPVEGVIVKWHKHATPRKVRSILCNTHILAMPVLRESYGIIFVEAMAAGCMVIADNDFPRREILAETGKLLPTHSIDNLANSLRSAFGNRDLIKQAGSAARNRYEEHYSPLVVANSYVDIFKSLL